MVHEDTELAESTRHLALVVHHETIDLLRRQVHLFKKYGDHRLTVQPKRYILRGESSGYSGGISEGGKILRRRHMDLNLRRRCSSFSCPVGA